MRNSVIIHLDSLSVLDELENDQAGLLFKAIKTWMGGDDPILDFGIKMAFIPFKNQFLRDKAKYEKEVEYNKINGSKGGLKRVANAKKRKRLQAEASDSSLNDSDSDNDSKNDNDKEIFNSFRVLFAGKKNGNDTEFRNFQKHKDWKDCLLKLKPAVIAEIEWRKKPRDFTPLWKNLSTWINQRCWEQEFAVETKNGTPIKTYVHDPNNHW